MLKVYVDGVALPDDEGRAFWARFSAHMELHKGDLAGFAKAEGFASVHPEMRGGEAALVASRTAAQRPYTSAPASRDKPPGGGSRASQPRPNAPAPRGSHPGKSRRSRG